MGVEAKSQLQQRTLDSDFEPIPSYWTMGRIRATIPPHLFERRTSTSSHYLARDLLLAIGAWRFATLILPFCGTLQSHYPGYGVAVKVLKVIAWLAYWWFQGLIFTGLFAIGHECGHGAFSPSRTTCNIIGFITHTFLLIPYFSWKLVHHRHHTHHANMGKDELYVPKTRSDFGIPDDSKANINWEEYFADTPVWSLVNLITMQLFGHQAFMLCNISGQKGYSGWTSFYNPNSVFFTQKQFNSVIISDIGILVMLYASKIAISCYSAWAFTSYYFIPWLLVNQWIVIFTYLHHTDAELPHYRSAEWTFHRGAAATVDRDFLGWQGQFFAHGVAHFHVVHHFFPQMPHYHCEEAKKYLKEFLGKHYHHSSDYIFPTLWKTYNECQFVDNDGDIVFYRNKHTGTSRGNTLSRAERQRKTERLQSSLMNQPGKQELFLRVTITI